LIYDAAHAFGVGMDAGSSLWNSGDLSVISFHGTKVFHTFEGGAIVCHDADMKARVDLLKNFGFRSEVEVVELGINAKMNEFQAAFGLYALAGVDEQIHARSRVAARYDEAIAGIPGLRTLPAQREVTRPNHAYYPILVESTFVLDRDGLYAHLKRHDIHVRRYFYPLISDFPMYAGARGRDLIPIAEAVAAKILCLPIHGGMDDNDCQRVIDALRAAG
jgi:dTDP-4-amino-4,6-dideoxygalactose transaminase